MNRLVLSVAEARKNKRKLFCAYVTLGYPSLEFTRKVIPALEASGADMIEVGIPFSDPQADGPVIQRASESSLRRGTRAGDAFKMCRDLRKTGLRIPLIFFSYYNPIIRFGRERFLRELKSSGFDGLIIPDLPPDEDGSFTKRMKRGGIAQIYLAAPTTKKSRLRLIARASTAFVYYVPLKGVTGLRKNTSGGLGSRMREIRKLTDKPVLVGFGVSSPKQAYETAKAADGVIVGSAIVEAIRKSRGNVGMVAGFVRGMVRSARKAGTHGVR